MAKGLDIKFKVLGDNSFVCKSYRGKLVRGREGGGFLSSPPILSRVKNTFKFSDNDFIKFILYFLVRNSAYLYEYMNND